MSTIERLGRKLRVGSELQSVVGTMKGIAAVSIHEYEEAVAALHEYTTAIEQGLQIAFRAHPELIPRPNDRHGVVVAIVIGTEQGLCGPVNREIAAHAGDWLAEHHPDTRRIVSMGRRATQELRLMGLDPEETLDLPGSVETIGRTVQSLIVRIDEWRRLDQVDRVMVFFQHPIRRTQRAPRVFQVMPPDVARLTRIAQRPWPTPMLPDSPHTWDRLVAGLLRQDLFIGLYRAIAEAKAAEHGARLAAMQAAEQNIEQRLEQLQREFHRLRQAQVTEQLLDVVAGFEALSALRGEAGEAAL